MDVDDHLKFLPTENSSSNLQQPNSAISPLPIDETYNLDDLLNANLKSMMNQQRSVEGIKMLPDDLIETVEKGNLADITLIGSIIKLLRSRGSASFTDIVDEISKFYHNLRRVDGSKYEGDISKAVRGCLTSSKIFYSSGNDIWTVQDQQAQIYERSTTQKLKALLTKKRSKAGRKPKEEKEAVEKLNSSDLVAENEISKARKKTKRSAEKYQQVYDMLNTSSKTLKANDGTAHLIQNPFKGLKGNENLPELWQRIGSERFVGIIQCFEYFSPLIEDQLKKQNLDAAGADDTEKSTQNISLEKIKTDFSNLYKNLLAFEKILPKDFK